MLGVAVSGVLGDSLAGLSVSDAFHVEADGIGEASLTGSIDHREEVSRLAWYIVPHGFATVSVFAGPSPSWREALSPRRASVCHCDMCLRWAGGPWIAVPVRAIECERDEGLTWFQSSELAERAFCNRCGASLFWRLTAEGKYQGTTSVTLGSLEDRSGVTLATEWFFDRKPEGYAFAGERKCVTEAEAFAILEEATGAS